MGRRGRSPSPSARRSAPAPSRAAPPPSRNVPATTPQQQTQPMVASAGAPQQPGLLKQMAATAGGVAIGSAVGHVVGHALVGGIGGGGGSDNDQPAPVQSQAPQQMQPQQQENACAFEMRQFIQCAQNQTDLTLCEGFNEALRQCKEYSGGSGNQYASGFR